MAPSEQYSSDEGLDDEVVYTKARVASQESQADMLIKSITKARVGLKGSGKLRFPKPNSKGNETHDIEWEKLRKAKSHLPQWVQKEIALWIKREKIFCKLKNSDKDLSKFKQLYSTLGVPDLQGLSVDELKEPGLEEFVRLVTSKINNSVRNIAESCRKKGLLLVTGKPRDNNQTFYWHQDTLKWEDPSWDGDIQAPTVPFNFDIDALQYGQLYMRIQSFHQEWLLRDFQETGPKVERLINDLIDMLMKTHKYSLNTVKGWVDKGAQRSTKTIEWIYNGPANGDSSSSTEQIEAPRPARQIDTSRKSAKRARSLECLEDTSHGPAAKRQQLCSNAQAARETVTNGYTHGLAG